MTSIQNNKSSISVLLLAGGNSVRMGKNKGLLPIDNTTFVGKLVALSEKVASHVLLSVGAHNAVEYENVPVTQIVDITPNRGPIGGVTASIPHIKTPWVFILSVDSPMITEDSLALLWDSKKNADGAVFAFGDKVHPLIGLYNHRALAQWKQSFQDGELRLQKIVSHMDLVKVAIPENQKDAVKNINTQKDYLEIITT